jgi:hypothetical protein
MNSESKFAVVAFAFMMMFTVAISAFGPSMLCVPTTKGNIACTGTESVLSRDYILNNNSTGIVYKSYPLEYPFTSGFFIQIVNTLSNGLGANVLLGQLYFTSVLLGLISVGIIIMYYRMGIDWKRAMLFYVLAPITIAYGWLETLQAFLFLAGVVSFGQKREGVAGAFLGLAAGVKYLPLLTIPFFYQKAQNKKKLLASSLGTFALGMGAEIALSPTNFLRSTSYYSTYGIEGSWIGLITGHIINYGQQQTWYIGTSTAIHIPQAYQIVSIVLMIAALYWIWKSKFNLVEKCLLVFAAEICLLWLSAPQFLINIAVLLPLVPRIRLSLRSVSLWWITCLCAFFPFVVFIGERFPQFTAAYVLQIVVEALLALFVYVELIRTKPVTEITKQVPSQEQPNF